MAILSIPPPLPMEYLTKRDGKYPENVISISEKTLRNVTKKKKMEPSLTFKNSGAVEMALSSVVHTPGLIPSTHLNVVPVI